MSRVRRYFFAIALSIIFISTLTAGTFFRAEAGDIRRPKGKSITAERSAAAATVEPRINEIDSDTPGTDAAEFVEISAAPGAALDGFVLVFFNGDTDLSYRAIDLDGLVADANGLVLIGNPGVAGVDLTFPNGTLQNGADAVAIYAGNAVDFPTGTAVTTAGLVDALVYDTADADDAGLLVLLNTGFAQKQIDEASGVGGFDANGIQRCLPGARDGRSFTVRPPSPNVPNLRCQETNVDYNGDRRSDFVITRSTGGFFSSNFAESPGPKRLARGDRRLQRSLERQQSLQGLASNQEWWILNNGVPGHLGAAFGDFFDTSIAADFDGDGRDDIAVWRPGAPEQAGFHSLNSVDYTYRYSPFGITGDDPTVVGDYDGDGKDDDATFRCPQTPGQCYFFYRASQNNPNKGITYVPWGYGDWDTYFTYPGDFNGDGRDDFCLQAAAPSNPNQGIFYLLNNVSYTYEYIYWGLVNDFLVPGDYDGDGRTDFTVMRIGTDDRYNFFTLERDGGQSYAQWGLGGDYITPGDYDADGRTDIAIYRWGQPNSMFWVLPSNGGPIQAITWGLEFDYPVAFWQVK